MHGLFCYASLGNRWIAQSLLPSGSRKIAMWQTPLSIVSGTNCTPAASSRSRAAWTSSTWSAIGARRSTREETAGRVFPARPLTPEERGER